MVETIAYCTGVNFNFQYNFFLNRIWWCGGVRQCCEKVKWLLCVISVLHRRVNEIFALLRCYAALIGRNRRFAIGPISKVQAFQS